MATKKAAPARKKAVAKKGAVKKVAAKSKPVGKAEKVGKKSVGPIPPRPFKPRELLSKLLKKVKAKAK